MIMRLTIFVFCIAGIVFPLQAIAQDDTVSAILAVKKTGVIVFHKKDVSFIHDNSEVIFFAKDTGSQSKKTGDCYGIVELKSGMTVFLPVFENEGGVPIIVDAFSYDFDGNGKNELFVICKWHQVHRAEMVNGFAYKVTVFADSAISIGGNFCKTIPSGTIMSFFKEGFEGLFQGKEVSYKYKTREAILNKLKPIHQSGISDSMLVHDCYQALTRTYKIKQLDISCALNLVRQGTLKKMALSSSNMVVFNDIGFYLIEAKKFDEALLVLRSVIEFDPTRTVAWLNLGDAQQGLNKTMEAKQSYRNYIELMEKSGKAAKVPKRVREFVR
ncbi:MAG: hypothetical protein JW768_12905 [Chitinispirillaceae bacterium]|nr:hypothetical protein [Chitinispirillaceae bacterium]